MPWWECIFQVDSLRVKREGDVEIIIRICQGFYKSLEIRAKSFQSVKHDCCLKEWNEARKRSFHLPFFLFLFFPPFVFPIFACLPPHHSFFHFSCYFFILFACLQLPQKIWWLMMPCSGDAGSVESSLSQVLMISFNVYTLYASIFLSVFSLHNFNVLWKQPYIHIIIMYQSIISSRTIGFILCKAEYNNIRTKIQSLLRLFISVDWVYSLWTTDCLFCELILFNPTFS